MRYAGRHESADPASSSPEAQDSELFEVAQAWAADDPDPQTREELEAVITAASAGDAAAHDDLVDRMSGLLQFGTAGLRGALGGGPNRMNRSVVIRAAAGLTAYLKNRDENPAAPFVVIGFDARTNSDVFARDTAAVVVAAGGRAAVLPRPLPTPVLAYAIRHLGADAGVMVTASHNPPQDNGYKVYLGDGSQIVSPSDVEIAAEISRIDRTSDVPLAEDGWETLDDEVLESYLSKVVDVVESDSPRDLVVVHTALHGVGSETVARAFEAAGYETPLPVPSQAQPDPAFPTVTFPNPEEPGAMDAALELAEQTNPDVVIANDPDADRCAVAVPGPGGWRMLRGDEVGTLLGAHLLDRGVPEGSVFANSIVSSRMLATVCRAAGVAHEETLTGFKWISRVDGLRFGYEEALGYCVDPARVRDKDGVSAALVVAEIAASLKAEGRSISDRLDDLTVEHGVHATDSFSVRVEDLSLIDSIMAKLRATPLESVAGVAVSRTDDLAEGDGGLPPTEGLRYFLEDDSRVIVRPSGTEPKLKVYLEVVEAVDGAEDLGAARSRAGERLAAIRSDVEAATSL
ncbi:phospho-sugar mutase [Knoellia subterranea]|uniref:Phosphomannomutase n=1 Tax=Knoellia subterranea KCTC 19937 TaxID=1385521 RepID=A0A0A0JJB7_9MICO|nr:phospho-sugar mutase [Knoellia subterranea]KGN36869.1 phosphomannomutase [Knoellia subterranea KCTC 19937]